MENSHGATRAILLNNNLRVLAVIQFREIAFSFPPDIRNSKPIVSKVETIS